MKHASPSAAHRLLVRALQFIDDGSARGAPSDSIVQHSPTAAASRVETLSLVLDAESLSERDRLGRFLPWLATIGSASPLIGLLGTVLGIISAFVGIATSGSGNLAAVAPGVAEALVATAAALAVAIPATFGYNILANRLNRLDNLLEGFGTTVIAMLLREGRL
jgi:biopolymer transport protein TolQ